MIPPSPQFTEYTGAHLRVVLTVLFVAFYALISAFLEHKHWPVHRTAVAIIIGIFSGLILKLSSPDIYNQLVQLDQTLVFSILLPPMIFVEGYALRKGHIGKNIRSILLYGVGGTFLAFLVNAALLVGANNLNLVRDVNDIHNYRNLSIWQVLILTACLCSIDTMASEESIPIEKHPHLHSIVLGQGILKDAVTIVLVRSILNLEERQSPYKLVVYWYTFFELIFHFAVLVSGSCFLGLLFGSATTFILKKCRFILHDKGVTETLLLFVMGMFAYLLSEMIDLSGVIGLMVYGIMLNHYNVYNLSEEGRQSASNTFLVFSTVCEGLLFLVMGIMIWQGEWESPTTDDDKMTHSYIFSLIVLVVLFIGRSINVYLLSAIKSLIRKQPIKWRQLHVLFLSGMVRGAVPFALFSGVKFNDTSHYSKNQGLVLKSTIIIVIIGTSVILNSLIPYFYKKLLRERKVGLLASEAHTTHNQGIDEHKQGVAEGQQGNAKRKVYSKLRQFEEKYVKPWLIYHYEERKQDIASIKLKSRERREEESVLSEE